MDPGINGRQTFEQILAVQPEQKAIITSGFSENEEVKKALQLGVSNFIRKPYTTEQIGTAVKKALL
ncbi:MAG: response regulator [Desulfobulbaceae bacterium]|nr:response regulator [Desulfobulbaceae bacterium]